jgi:hypothetical protein
MAFKTFIRKDGADMEIKTDGIRQFIAALVMEAGTNNNNRCDNKNQGCDKLLPFHDWQQKWKLQKLMKVYIIN